MLKIHRTSQFKKDFKKAVKSEKEIKLLVEIIEKLVKKEPLPTKNRDHNLSENYANFRECHIQPDWLLIYKYDEETLFLTRIGSHSDLF
ncbi:type II toxin-antitoxin system YafQ family toxin [Geminocystis herdmanii]|uniref:type II toxin-antitoxin system YafQ family toxin n=1 Tax=Geminocystis herdmanii TaxID=669359 RepID=UPI000346342D|nr:type II toxin-antitoxin system YafQ family toxin [Geminocystis herdmanii]